MKGVLFQIGLLKLTDFNLKSNIFIFNDIIKTTFNMPASLFVWTIYVYTLSSFLF